MRAWLWGCEYSSHDTVRGVPARVQWGFKPADAPPANTRIDEVASPSRFGDTVEISLSAGTLRTSEILGLFSPKEFQGDTEEVEAALRSSFNTKVAGFACGFLKCDSPTQLPALLKKNLKTLNRLLPVHAPPFETTDVQCSQLVDRDDSPGILFSLCWLQICAEEFPERLAKQATAVVRAEDRNWTNLKKFASFQICAKRSDHYIFGVDTLCAVFTASVALVETNPFYALDFAVAVVAACNGQRLDVLDEITNQRQRHFENSDFWWLFEADSILKRAGVVPDALVQSLGTSTMTLNAFVEGSPRGFSGSVGEQTPFTPRPFSGGNVSSVPPNSAPAGGGPRSVELKSGQTWKLSPVVDAVQESLRRVFSKKSNRKGRTVSSSIAQKGSPTSSLLSVDPNPDFTECYLLEQKVNPEFHLLWFKPQSTSNAASDQLITARFNVTRFTSAPVVLDRISQLGVDPLGLSLLLRNHARLLRATTIEFNQCPALMSIVGLKSANLRWDLLEALSLEIMAFSGGVCDPFWTTGTPSSAFFQALEKLKLFVSEDASKPRVSFDLWALFFNELSMCKRFPEEATPLLLMALIYNATNLDSKLRNGIVSNPRVVSAKNLANTFSPAHNRTQQPLARALFPSFVESP